MTNAVLVLLESVVTLTGEASFRVGTCCTGGTVVDAELAFINVKTFSAVSNVSLGTVTFVRSGRVGTSCNVCTLSHAAGTFVNVFTVSPFATSFVSVFTDTSRLICLFIVEAVSIVVARVLAALVKRLAEVSVAFVSWIAFALVGGAGVDACSVGVTFVGAGSALVLICALVAVSNKPFFAETVVTAEVVDTVGFFVTRAGSGAAFVAVVTFVSVPAEARFAFAAETAWKVVTVGVWRASMGANSTFINVNAVHAVSTVPAGAATFGTAKRVDTIGEDGTVVCTVGAFIVVVTRSAVTAEAGLTFAAVCFVAVDTLATLVGAVVEAEFTFVNVGTAEAITAESLATDTSVRSANIDAVCIESAVVQASFTFVYIHTNHACAFVTGCTFTVICTVL